MTVNYALRESKRIELKLNALIIGKTKLRENDIIIKFLAENFGRIDAAVFGIKKSEKKFTGHFELFSEGKAFFTKRSGSELWTLKEFETQTDVKSNGDSWKHIIALQSAAELLILGGPFERTESNIYQYAIDFNKSIMKSPDPFAPLLAFAVQWLTKNGFGLPAISSESNAHKFIQRVLSDSTDKWPRYRLTDKTKRILITAISSHIEESIDRQWKGIGIMRRIKN